MEIESNLQDRQFGSLEAELSAHEARAEQISDEDLARGIGEIRSAVSSCGLSVSSIGHVKESDASAGGGKMAMASYDTSSKKISSVGADEMLDGADSAGLGVREYVRAIFEHEKAHAQSDAADGGETDRVLTTLFGQEAVHVTEEATASQVDGAVQTARFDAYGAERAKADQYASQLGIGGAELRRIRLAGDSRALIGHALEAGMLEDSMGGSELAA